MEVYLMKIEKENLKRARDLLNELEKLEQALNIMGNYDATISAQFKSIYNNNKESALTVVVPISEYSKKFILDDINLRIEQIKKELGTI